VGETNPDFTFYFILFFFNSSNLTPLQNISTLNIIINKCYI